MGVFQPLQLLRHRQFREPPQLLKLVVLPSAFPSVLAIRRIGLGTFFHVAIKSIGTYAI
jgi:ABC-type nitrate/sulfonate/bicarbonate transport system permease component